MEALEKIHLYLKTVGISVGNMPSFADSLHARAAYLADFRIPRYVHSRYFTRYTSAMYSSNSTLRCFATPWAIIHGGREERSLAVALLCVPSGAT